MRVHFIGIGGIGISGLARYLKELGHTISGSDIKSNYITKELEDEGVKITVPHSSSAIDNQDMIIYSAAIKMSNPEILRAIELDIKVYSRREALEFILGDKKIFSVCGAHGKSTTTAILSSILQECSSIIGAQSKEFGSNMRYRDSDCIVFEADESDGSFLNSNPHYGIVTNAEPEHMEFYNNDLNLFFGAYERFLKSAKIRVINAEDEFLSKLDIEAKRLYPSKEIKNISYILIDDEPHTRFELKGFGYFDVWGFGEHIAIDASLAILVAVDFLDIESIRERLLNYKGIKKRFDIINKDKTILIDDYAHHPTEIRVTLESIKEYAKLKDISDITTIWQPHKYSRTLTNLDSFRSCFKGSQKLIILPVYSAGEESVEIDFMTNFREYNLTLADRVVRDEDRLLVLRGDEVIESLQDTLVVGFGAGDITYQLRGGAY